MKRIIGIIIVTLLTSIVTIAQVNIKKGLVLHIDTDDNSDDHSKSELHGTNNGVKFTEGREPGHAAYEFTDTKDQYVQIPHDPKLNLSKSMTMMVWFKSLQPASGDRQYTLVSKLRQMPKSTKVSGYELELQEGRLIFETSSRDKMAQYREYRSKSKILKDKWYCAVVTWDQETISIFLDGRKDTSYLREFNFPNNDVPIRIGQRGTLHGQEPHSLSFNGSIDELRLYNRVLSLQEIQFLAHRNVENGTSQLIPVQEGEGVIIKGMVISNMTKKGIAAQIEFYESTDKTFPIFSQKDGNFKKALERKEMYFVKVSARDHLTVIHELDLGHVGNNQSLTKDFILEHIDLNKEIVMEHILFHRGADKFVHSSFKELNEVANMLINNPSVKIELGGHSDNQGNEDLNVKLSEERVQAVISYLVSKGVEASRMHGTGYGSQHPIASNNHESTRKLNRRVEYKIVSY